MEGKRTMPRELLTPRWIVTTLLVVVAVGVMVRLGVWQLDRLEERRQFNARVQAQIEAPPLDLNTGLPADLDQLYNMEYRQVILRGEYDPSNEILLRNQVWENQPGHHLLTPLRLAGTGYAVLVDRGFIALNEGQPAARAQYARPGVVELTGILKRPQNQRRFGVPDPTLAPDETRLDAWNAVNLTRIQEQVNYPLLPVYVLAAPDPAQPGPPYASLEQPDLSEGPHMGYAIQWFSFAAVLGIGYPFFVQKQLAEGPQRI
jgi:surfeit locus 1 family protein